MAGFIVDRRLSGKNKSVPNRVRLLERVKSRVAKQVKRLISSGSIERVLEDAKYVSIPVGDIKELHPSYSQHDGRVDIIVTGNTKYRVGDLITKPPGGGQGSGGGESSDDGDSEDEFGFALTQDEFLKYFFEDLELPNMLNRDIEVVDEYRTRKAGYSPSGVPSNLSLIHTMQQSTGRRVALRAGKKRLLRELEARMVELEEGEQTDESQLEIDALTIQMEELKRKIKAVPFVDEIDLRYRTTVKEPVPTTHAVMFCMLDASGSMTQWHKDIAKRFFMMLYLFLHKRYERIELVFVRYTHNASEVDEQTFFYDRQSGGTLASSGLEVVRDIIKDRYDRKRYNMYVAHASDGDNWGSDGQRFTQLLQESILPALQHYFYVEVGMDPHDYDLMQTFKNINAPNLQYEKIQGANEIFNVFRRLFGGNKTE